MNTLFEYIERHLEKGNSVSLDTWGNNTRTAHYNTMNSIFAADAPVMEYEGQHYLVTSSSATSGMGGMSEGSPHTYNIKKLDMKRINHIKNDRPMPVANPDFSSVIKNLEITMNNIVNGDYHEDNDDDHYVWEEVMKAVYGKNIFDWWNENIN